MRTMLRAGFVFILAMLIAACASVPAGNKPRRGMISDEHALIYLFNDVGGIKIGGELMVVNGVHGGSLDRREYTWFLVPAGEMRLSLNDNMMKSRKLAARIFNVAAGQTYYISYALRGHRPNDASLIYEGLSGASDGNDNFNSSDLELLSEGAALRSLEAYDLVGNKFDSRWIRGVNF